MTTTSFEMLPDGHSHVDEAPLDQLLRDPDTEPYAFVAPTITDDHDGATDPRIRAQERAWSGETAPKRRCPFEPECECQAMHGAADRLAGSLKLLKALAKVPRTPALRLVRDPKDDGLL